MEEPAIVKGAARDFRAQAVESDVPTNADRPPSFDTGRLFEAVIVCIYVLGFPPFVFQGFLDTFLPGVRSGIEVLALALLGRRLFGTGLRSAFWLLGVVLSIFSVHLLTLDSATEVRTGFAILGKFTFAIVLANALVVDHPLRQLLAKAWFGIGWYLAGSAVIATGAHLTGIATFAAIEHPGEFGLGLYDYYFHPLFGSFILKNLSHLGLPPLPRFSSWVIEPGLLAFVYAQNIVLAGRLTRSPTVRKAFMIVNFAAGLMTWSTTYCAFALLLAACVCFSYLRQRNSSAVTRRLVLGVAVIIIIILPAVLVQASRYVTDVTSSDDRILRAVDGVWFVIDRGVRAVLFGTGSTAYLEETHRGQSMGLLKLVLERGSLALLAFAGLVGFFTRKNLRHLLLVAIFFLATELFPWPLFWFGLAIDLAMALDTNGTSPALDGRKRQLESESMSPVDLAGLTAGRV